MLALGEGVDREAGGGSPMTVKVKLNSKAVRDLLRSDAVESDMLRRAQAIARAAGDGMSADSFVGRNRAGATAWTDTPEAMRAEATDRKLTSAIDAGRD